MADPTMRSGDLRHRVTHQTYSEVLDGRNQSKPVWSDANSYWCFVKPLSARELVNADKLREDVTHSVTMRYPIGVTISPKDRFKFGSRTLAIDSVINVDERNYCLQLLCIEVV